MGFLVDHRPIILTGCPRGDWSELQKIRWAERYFPGIPLITSRSSQKRIYCLPGDILIDDTLKYRHLWKKDGGIFVHHRTYAETVEQLETIGVLGRARITSILERNK